MAGLDPTNRTRLQAKIEGKTVKVDKSALPGRRQWNSRRSSHGRP